MIKEVLEIFHNATNIFSGVYYPTTCVTINQTSDMPKLYTKEMNIIDDVNNNARTEDIIVIDDFSN